MQWGCCVGDGVEASGGWCIGWSHLEGIAKTLAGTTVECVQFGLKYTVCCGENVACDEYQPHYDTY